MDISDVLLGPVRMLDEAMRQHCKKYARNPKRFELHPAVIEDIICHADKLPYGMVVITPEGMKFKNIDVIADVQAIQPKLITCNNQVEYL
jgi:hypothetical protein